MDLVDDHEACGASRKLVRLKLEWQMRREIGLKGGAFGHGAAPEDQAYTKRMRCHRHRVKAGGAPHGNLADRMLFYDTAATGAMLGGLR
jgi:hypothetical protein